MRLLNADGSASEVSGNGVRCLAALVAEEHAPERPIVIATDAGEKTLALQAVERPRYTFRAAMGAPTDLRRETLDVAGQRLDVVVLRVGNPQCVLLEQKLDERRLYTVGAALAVHPAFPEGTNVELAAFEPPDIVRILIWERGVGPTTASGTGACAAAVAAAAYGGAPRDVHVVSPGGAQRVEWREEGLYLTGWAEVLFDARWRHP
jgi:diaminopimelate epimerase